MAKAIMIQGTMSNAGKSLLAAGLCRIFCQDGYRVAPFKSQNMALNSFITREGLEMGRAQVVQAQAAKVSPSVDMNPILLKPSSDTGSQVIVSGVPVATMAARDYFRYKKSLVPSIMEAYGRLDRKYDIIVIEGAGSPAEINLKSDDIVNMGMARMAKAPVLLAGDIDRGGVFAQLYGTVMLLEPEERKMVKGLIINKFRGDKSILDPGVEMIEDLCRIPVVGVTPYMDVDIEIRFPRLSNFTDFHVLSAMKGASVRYVSRSSELGRPDMIILPGTKNTMGDLLWMRQNGLEALILKAAAKGTPIWGICGGYQMMGESLVDEAGTENGIPGQLAAGMGLIGAVTSFHEEKTRTRITGRFEAVPGIFKNLSGMKTEGYEIHMGKTKIRENGTSLLSLTEYQNGAGAGKRDGTACGNIYGTYVHGIFDGPGVAAAVTEALLEAKGISGLKTENGDFDYHAYRESQYDKLAQELRTSLDMEAVYRILEDGLR